MAYYYPRTSAPCSVLQPTPCSPLRQAHFSPFMFARVTASSSSGDDSPRPLLKKSRHWSFMIPDPSCRPSMEGSLRHVSYDTFEDRIVGVASFAGPQSNPLRKYGAVVRAITAAEFHRLFPTMTHHAGSQPMDRVQSIAAADAVNRRHVAAAKEGRLDDLPLKSRPHYLRYNEAYKEELRSFKRAAKRQAAFERESVSLPQPNETHKVDVFGTYNATQVNHYHGPVTMNSGPVTYIRESTLTEVNDGHITEDNSTNIPSTPSAQ